MDYTILVTGSTGHVGSRVVKQLSSFKGKVRAAVHSKNHAQEIKNTARPIPMSCGGRATLRPMHPTSPAIASPRG